MTQDYVTHLLTLIETATPSLHAISDETSSQRPAPGKWSPREIIGHLIDSASNNHQRFVRAQLQDDLVFPGYEQDAWVAVQRYQQAPWRELVELWAGFNRHIARVMEKAPEMRRRRSTTSCAITWHTSSTTSGKSFPRADVGRLFARPNPAVYLVEAVSKPMR
jgi:DinB family protein